MTAHAAVLHFNQTSLEENIIVSQKWTYKRQLCAVCFDWNFIIK